MVPRRPARAALVLVAVALTATVAACAGTEPVQPEASLEVVEVSFPRLTQAERKVFVNVAGDVPAGMRITSAALDSPLFTDSPVRDTPKLLWTDRETPIAVGLGVPACGATGPSALVVTTSVDDGEVRLPLPDEPLTSIQAEECRVEAVFDVAQAGFGPVTAADDRQLSTTLTLERGTQGSTATLDGVAGNIIFAVDVDAPVVLAEGEQSASVPAVITVRRCDSHAFAESKKTYVFAGLEAVDGEEPLAVEFGVEPSMQAALLALFEACGALEMP